MQSKIDAIIESLTAQFASRFHETLRPLRKVGREAEFPVVTRDGRAADVTALLHALCDEQGFVPHYDDPATQKILIGVERAGMSVAIEVGRGTVEITTPPGDDLWELQRVFDDALARVVRVAASREMFLLGFGIQPRTPATRALMTPRQHYHALYNAIGAPWLKLTTTAADQTHVDICRAELLDAINWMNLVSASLIALCANSSVYAGRVGQFISGREGLLHDLGEDRYGMTPRKFSSLEEFIRYLCDYRCFILSNGGKFKRINHPFVSQLSNDPTTQPSNLFSDFLFHEHYVWNSARARVAISTIEVRPACQQPPDDAFAVNALILGWVESLPQIAAYFDDALGAQTWEVMRAYRRAAVCEGLGAREPIPGMIRALIEIAQAGLARRGRGEEKFLEPIWERVERRESPGMRARRVMQKRGMGALIKRCVIRDA
jgi:gamma-glutamylcysteine synthetase